MWLGWAGHLSPPGALCSHQCHLGQLKGQWHREIGSPLPPCQLVGWRPALCWAVLMPSCCPLSGTSDTGRGARRGSQGALWRHMALMGTLLLSLPAISQEGPWQLMAAPWGDVHGESAEPSTDAGDRRWLCQQVTGHSRAGQCCGLAGSIQGARQPHPCRQMPGSRTALPGCGGPSIRHAALSAGSLLSPRQ